MFKIADIVSLLCVLVLSILLGKDLPYAIGGSIWLIVLMAFFYFVSYALRIFQKEITLLNIILILIIGINYLNYLDLYETYSKENIAISFCILAILIFLCIYLAVLKPWTFPFEENRKDEVRAILRLNLKAVVLRYELFSFVYLLFICILFTSFHTHFTVSSNILRMIPIGFVCIIFTVFLMRFALGKIERAHLELIFNNEDSKFSDSLSLKTLLLGIVGVSFIFGSMIELVRNQWLLWLTSFGTATAIILLILQIYRHKVSPRKEISSISINGVKFLGTPQYWIKFAVINFIGLLLVTITLMFLLYVFVIV
ncbi:MAG: hypothetical protein SVW57_08890 [Thermodesulfobacteriota bacterium]|nr:hypothetical protein [Thermodesulfobacteriota bacterium]